MRHIFCRVKHILSGRDFEEEGSSMWEMADADADLDDLIFEKDAGGPSER